MSDVIMISQRDEFECAYILKIKESDEPIFNCHHYRIEVSVSGQKPFADDGIIIEFSDLKKLIRAMLPDHQFVYCKNGPIQEQSIAAAFVEFGVSVKGYEFAPSAENLVKYFAEVLQLKLNSKFPGVLVEEVKLRETANSFSTWSRNDCKCSTNPVKP